MDIFSIFDPLKHTDANQYLNWWQYILHTVLQGFIGKLVAVTLLAIAFWLFLKARNIYGGVVCVIGSACVAYGYPVLRMFGISV